MTNEVFTSDDDTFIRAQKLVRLLGLPAEQERRIFEILEAFEGWDVAEEREACAQKVDVYAKHVEPSVIAFEELSAAIRARAATPSLPHIEVTPEMIEAGFTVLSASGLADDYGEADRLLLREIFVAMSRAPRTDGYRG